MVVNVRGNLTELLRHLQRNNYTSAANLLNVLATRQNFVKELNRVPGLSSFLATLQTTAGATRARRILFPHESHRYNFPGAPARRLSEHFIPLYNRAVEAQLKANENAAARRGPEENMENAWATAAAANRLRREAAAANERARANAVEASRREAAAARAARDQAQRRANAATAEARRRENAAAAAAERARNASTPAGAAHAADQANAHANAADNAAARGGGAAAIGAAARARKNAAAAAAAAEKKRERERAAEQLQRLSNATTAWQQRFNAFKGPPHFLTKRQIIRKMARNHLGINIPNIGIVTVRNRSKLHPDKEKNINRKALRQVLFKEFQ